MSTPIPTCAHCGAVASLRALRCAVCAFPLPPPAREAASAPRPVRGHASASGPRPVPGHAAACMLTTKDHAILSGCLLRHPEHDRFVVAAARQKLAHGRVVLTEDVDADVVTIGARVYYDVDGAAAAECVLGYWDEEPAPDGRLALRTRRGVCLLGMRAGAAADIVRHDGGIERLRVLEVLYQPERARRAAGAAPPPLEPVAGPIGAAVATVVSLPVRSRPAMRIVAAVGDGPALRRRREP